MSETDALDPGMTKGEPTLEQWRSIAWSLFNAGERSGHEVIEANAAILDLDRSDDAARTRLGFAYRLEGDFDSAEAVYRQILESSAPGAQHYRTAEKALALIEKERTGQIKPFSPARQMAAVVNADDAYQRASALRDARKLDLALRWVQRGLELAKRQGRAKLRRGLAVRASIRRAKGEPERALDDARASVNLGLGYDENSSAFIVLTATLVDLGRLDEAVSLAKHHLEPDVENHYAMNAAGRAFFEGAHQTGEVDLLERSERCFRRAAELEPNKSARARLMEVAQRYRDMRMTDRASDLEAFLERLHA